MGLSNRKEEQLRRMPLIETKVSKSKDGRFLIHRTIITHIKPMVYYKAIVENASKDVEVEEIDMADLEEAMANS